MAKIVFGVGSSHSPLLASKPEEWDYRADDDRKNPHLPFRGKNYAFNDLLDLRRGECLADAHTMEERRQRDARNQRQLDLLGEKIKAADLDVLVIFGDDQREVLLSDISPMFLVFTGAKIPFLTRSKERFEAMSKGEQIADWSRHPTQDMYLKGAPELANHVVRSVVADGFDLAVSDGVIEKDGGDRGIGHAFGFYFHRVLDDLKDTPKMATLPIFINTFFPPNQPTVARVLAFGKAVGRAIQSWDGGARVGIAASGGMSHFVIDEDLDRRLMAAIKNRDEKALLAEPEANFQSGTSEIKNWIAAMAALEGSGLEMDVLDYVPCYRTDAGTGTAMAYALWQ